MKFGALFLLNFLILAPAMGEDISHSRRQIMEMLSTIKQQLGPNFYHACREDVQDVRIVNCGKKHSRVLSDYVLAVVQLNKLRDQVAAYSQRPNIRNNSERRRKVASVSQVLACMRRMSDDLVMTCTRQGCNQIENTMAFTLRSVERDIQICPGYFSFSRQATSGTLLHELSHECGTLDFEYLFATDETYRSPSETYQDWAQKFFGLSTDITARNADHFRYWARYGFCLPGYDCRR